MIMATASSIHEVGSGLHALRIVDIQHGQELSTAIRCREDTI